MSEDRGQRSRRPATERADELLNRAGWTAGLFASMIGMRLARIAAFAREEAEDLWAEAQSIRQADDERSSSAARGKAEEQKAEPGQATSGAATTGTATAEAPPKAEEQKSEPEQRAEPDEEV